MTRYGGDYGSYGNRGDYGGGYGRGSYSGGQNYGVGGNYGGRNYGGGNYGGGNYGTSYGPGYGEQWETTHPEDIARRNFNQR